MLSGSEHRRRSLRTQRARYVGVVIIGVLLALATLVVDSSYYRYAGVLLVMYMTMATGWNYVGGFTGYISLGHAAFFGFGAYATGLIANESRTSVIVALAATVVITLVVGFALGRVALRVRGSSFVIVTIALVYMGVLIAQGWRDVTGGSTGLDVAGLWRFDSRASNHAAYIVTFAAVLVVVMAGWNFIDGSKFGMGLKAIREDEDRAQALGVNVTAFKTTAFAISAAIVGLCGGLYASWTGFIDPIFVFSVQISAQLVLMSLLGGMRFLWGPVLGALIIVPTSEFFLINLPRAHLLATGLLLAAVVLLMPDGVLTALRGIADRRRPQAASIRESGGTVLTERSDVDAGVPS